jgi:hypothetical protein
MLFYLVARVAQSAEHLHGKQKVTGSIPVLGSPEKKSWQRCLTQPSGFFSARYLAEPTVDFV